MSTLRHTDTGATLVNDRLDPPAETLAVGTAVGRFTVLGLLGLGGMGAVYRAFDQKLDRQIALKLVRQRSSPIRSKPSRS